MARRDSLGCPIVGVGASAGGLEAFSAFLKALPPRTGLAFVYIQHLSPKRESLLTALLSKAAKIPVKDAVNGQRVEPDHVYVIPPGVLMTVSGGTLRLAPSAGHGLGSLPIDHFLESLAREMRSRAIGVVLSGTASDGVHGLEAVKAEGGLTIAQDARSARYAGMPRKAAEAGCVDLILPPARIAAELARIAKHPYVARRDGAPQGTDARALAAIFRHLKLRTGIEFANYKRSTILRRIARRMALRRQSRLDAYAELLGRDSAETKVLGSDLLIRVTEFFREPAGYRHLTRSLLPRLLRARPPHAPLRIWVPGCATGEEAYSLAMSAVDFLGPRLARCPVQVFGTDVSDQAVERARLGRYPERAMTNVPPRYRRRFFVKVEGGWQIAKKIRELCVFAKQNLTKDPPFSRLDLVSCRNVLIYLEPEAQKKVLSVFHYALKPRGCLILGGSETVGALGGLFEQSDKRHRVYAKRTAGARLAVPEFDVPQLLDEAAAELKKPSGGGEPDVYRQADRLLLAKHTPAAVLVDQNMDIIQFRGQLGPYLEPASGRASLNLLKMARECLAFELRAAVEEARRKGAGARRQGVPLVPGPGGAEVDLEVLPLRGEGRGRAAFLLVLFKPAPAPEPKAAPRGGRGRELERLKRELQGTREHLQSLVEQHEAANEELQSTNEEILSSNEELQSTNEELETAKEELQSINEELTTLNEEAQQRNLQLAQANDDLNNFIAGVSIPVIIVGSDLKIRRFTPWAEKALGLIPDDVGRPIRDLRLMISVHGLQAAIEEAVETAQVQELEGRDEQGRWFSVRIRPYKTRENRIDGVLVMFVDVDTLRRSMERFREARDYSESVLEALREPLLTLTSDLKVRGANRAFYDFFQLSPERTVGRGLASLGGEHWRRKHLRELVHQSFKSGASFSDVAMECSVPGRGRRTLAVNIRKAHSEAQNIPLVLIAMQDVTESLQAQEAEDLRRRVAMHRDFMANVSHQLRTPIAAVQGFTETLIAGAHADPRQRLAFLHRVDAQVRRIGAMVENLLRVSSLESGRRKPEPSHIALGGFVKALLESVEPIAHNRGVSLNVRVAPAASVYCDRSHLYAILQNLVENAIKFNRRGGTVEVSASPKGDEKVVSVTDTGIGISQKDMPYVFERFRSGRGSEGAGLGLSIAKGLVELNRGRIWISKTNSRGTTVSFTMPRRR